MRHTDLAIKRCSAQENGWATCGTCRANERCDALQKKTDFDASDWETRLSNALRALAKTQKNFLQDYWNTNGYPAKQSFNGKDETPFPTDDYLWIYSEALVARTGIDKEYYKPLTEALAPVRSLLRVHPAFTSVLGMNLGPEAVQVGIGSGQAYTRVEQFISGLMARQYDRTEKEFLRTAEELNSLLLLSSRNKTSPLKNNLDLGLDIDLFYGAKLTKKYDLGSGYFMAPFHELRDYIEPEWFQDLAPNQVRARDFDMFFGVVAPFRWKPEIRHAQAFRPDERPRDVPPLFHRVAAEFVELLSVMLDRPIMWVYDFPSVTSKTSSQLLGQCHHAKSGTAGEFVGKFYDPFRKQDPANTDQIEQAIGLFSRKSETNYAVIAPLLHRLAEAQRTYGRFAKEDRILDLAIIFERYFPEGKTYKKELSRKISSLLGSSSEEIVQIAKDIELFYRVRNAIIHGGKNKGDRELLQEIDMVLEKGFRYARALLLSSIE